MTPQQPDGSTAARVANALLFNVSWFAIVVSHNTAVALAVVVLHLAAHSVLVNLSRGELVVIALVSLLGAALDQALFLVGVFTVAGQSALAPLWLSCLWPVFATTLLHAFAGLQGRQWLAALVGAAGGALSYVVGVRLSDVAFADPQWGPGVIALLWALLFPLLLTAAVRLSRAFGPLPAWETPGRRAHD